MSHITKSKLSNVCFDTPRYFSTCRINSSSKLKYMLGSADISDRRKKSEKTTLDTEQLKGLRTQLFPNYNSSLDTNIEKFERNYYGTGRSRVSSDGNVNERRKLDKFLKSLTEKHSVDNNNNNNNHNNNNNNNNNDQKNYSRLSQKSNNNTNYSEAFGAGAMRLNPFGMIQNNINNSNNKRQQQQQQSQDNNLEFKTGSRHNNTLSHLMRKNDRPTSNSRSALETLRLETERKEAEAKAINSARAANAEKKAAFSSSQISKEAMKLQEASKILKSTYERIQSINSSGTIRLIKDSRDAGITTYNEVRKGLDITKEGLIVKSVVNIEGDDGEKTPIAVVEIVPINVVLRVNEQQKGNNDSTEELGLNKNKKSNNTTTTTNNNNKSIETKIVRISWNIGIPDLNTQKKKEILNFIEKNEKMDIFIGEKPGNLNNSTNGGDISQFDRLQEVELSDLENLRRNKILSEVESILQENRASFKIHGNVSQKIVIRVLKKDNVEIVSKELSKEDKRKLKEQKKLERQAKIKEKTEAKLKAIEEAKRLAAGL